MVEGWGGRWRKIYMYRSDLEKLDTKALINILRKLRTANRIHDWDYYEYEFGKTIEETENTWTEYKYVEYGTHLRQDEYYTMIWMVKDVLSRREHVPTSKIEKRKIRQEKAKHRNSRKHETYWHVKK